MSKRLKRVDLPGPLLEINIYTNMPNAVILKGVEIIILEVIFIFISYVCRERELCVHGSNGYPRSVFLSGNKRKISQWEGRLLVNCVPMREQRTTKITLNSVCDILKLIPLFTVASQKVTLSNVVNLNAYFCNLCLLH